MVKARIKRSIEKVWVSFPLDDSPDTSWLGEYSNSPGPEDKTIDRKERGEMERNEFRYFIAANSPEDTGNPDSLERDYARMGEIACGDVWFVGVIAHAKITINRVSLNVQSGGIWGIESDSGRDYLRDEVGGEQLEELRQELRKLGFSSRSIDTAFTEVTYSND